MHGGVLMAAISVPQSETAGEHRLNVREMEQDRTAQAGGRQRGPADQGNAVLEILAANQGDMNRLATLYDRYHRSLQRIASSIVQDSGDAHDVVVDVFLKVCQLPTERLPSANGPAWLRRLARNQALDFLRKSRRCQPTADMEVICGTVSADQTGEMDLQLLLAHLDSVPRRIVVEKIVSGKTHQEIGKVLGMSETSICRIYRQALSQLREILMAQAAGN